MTAGPTLTPIPPELWFACLPCLTGYPDLCTTNHDKEN